MLRVSVVAGCVCSLPSSDPYWDSLDKLCALRIGCFLFPKLQTVTFRRGRTVSASRVDIGPADERKFVRLLQEQALLVNLICDGKPGAKDVMFSADICPVVFSSLFFSTFSKKEQVLDSVCQTLKNTLPNFGQSVSLWRKLLSFWH